MELLQQPDATLRAAALRLLHSVAAEDPPVLESLSLVGLVPIVNALTPVSQPAPVRRLAGAFVERLCSTSEHTVQMFVACGGLAVLVGVRFMANGSCACGVDSSTNGE